GARKGGTGGGVRGSPPACASPGAGADARWGGAVAERARGAWAHAEPAADVAVEAPAGAGAGALPPRHRDATLRPADRPRHPARRRSAWTRRSPRDGRARRVRRTGTGRGTIAAVAGV